MSLFSRYRVRYEHPEGYFVERRKWYWFGWEAIGYEKYVSCYSWKVPYYCKTIEDAVDIVVKLELSVRL